MRLYNTLTRKTEEFKPIRDKIVSLYTCGPTVYDRLHIGNWVSYIRWDTLVRLLGNEGYEVKRVLNITDVGHLVSDADEGEDKLEKSARREGKTAWEIAQTYTDDFTAGMRQLNLTEPTYYAKATEHISEQIEFIKQLESKGYTYKISDGIYFDISKFPAYSDFGRLDLAKQQEGARVATNPQKRHPQDFALWKFSPAAKKRDMEWDSPWGKGFPCWHLECSAMAMKYLGETIDIHTGGIDHIPIHHTNEIAQSQALSGKKFASFWLHNNFLLVDGQKISKSLGNGYTLDDLKAHGFSPLNFKMFVLQSHYRSESNFTWENLEAARTRLQSLFSFADLRWQLRSLPQNKLRLHDAQTSILSALDDDMNTPVALSHLSEVVSGALEAISAGQAEFDGFLNFLDKLFGFNLSDRTDISAELKNLLSKREAARKSQDWAKADELRKLLHEQGLEINDTPHGPTWSRI